mmetsp:Transcript_137030/g.273313  ORF Transcript_137030/g.273313 Transcript_137030/m.273313 type:complete len:216 (-) Transcript_137030:71-718(-)
MLLYWESKNVVALERSCLYCGHAGGAGMLVTSSSSLSLAAFVSTAFVDSVLRHALCVSFARFNAVNLPATELFCVNSHCDNSSASTSTFAWSAAVEFHRLVKDSSKMAKTFVNSPLLATSRCELILASVPCATSLMTDTMALASSSCCDMFSPLGASVAIRVAATIKRPASENRSTPSRRLVFETAFLVCTMLSPSAFVGQLARAAAAQVKSNAT